MKELFLNGSLSFIDKYCKYNENDKKKLLYGLEGIYLTITKTIIILLVAAILEILKETLILVLLFNLIRYTGFGFHAEKSWHCLVCSLINFVFLPYVMLKINFSNISILLISTICIINYLLFAPADTIKRPLPNKRKRLIRKILTISIGIIYTVLIFILNNKMFTSLLLNALIIQAVVINPITYMIFNQPYNNYKNFN